MIPFDTLVRAELRKTVDVRAARWMLFASALLVAGAEAVPLVFPHNVTQDRASYLTWAALGLSRLLPLVLLMAMTAEWSQRTAMTTFTLEPRRGRVLAAKATAGLIISVIAGLFALLAGTVAVFAASHAGRPVAEGWNWSQLAGFALFIVLTSAVGMALGAAVHNTAAAIVSYFVLAGLFSLLMIPALQKAGDWINTGTTFGWVLVGDWSGHVAQIAVCAALWIALPLAVGTVRTVRREVH
jgi:ABC-2 type transport system permease protein